MNETLRVRYSNVANVRVETKKMLYTAQSPRGSNSGRNGSGPQTQHGQRKHLQHGNFEVAPKEFNFITSQDGRKIEADDKNSLVQSLSNDVKRKPFGQGQMNFYDGEKEASREAAANRIFKTFKSVD